MVEAILLNMKEEKQVGGMKESGGGDQKWQATERQRSLMKWAVIEKLKADEVDVYAKYRGVF